MVKKKKTNRNYKGKKSAPVRSGKDKTKAPEKSQRRSGKRGLKVFFIIVLVLVLAAAGVGAAYYFTDGFGTKRPDFLIRSGGETYTKNTEGVKLNTGKVFEVQDLTGSGDYTVTIAAKGTAENDFEFQIGEETGYRWKDQNGKDYTEGFQISKTETGFKVEYIDLTQIITTVKGTTSAVLSESAGGDLFALTVKSGSNEFTLGFRLYYVVDGIEVDPPEIIFPKPDDKPGGDGEQQPPDVQEPDDTKPEDTKPDDLGTLAGVYKFYMMTDGTNTYYVGDIPEGGVIQPVLTEEYVVIELIGDGNGTMSMKYGPMNETSAFTWRTDPNNSNKIIVSAEGAKDSALVRMGETIVLQMQETTYVLKKQAQNTSQAEEERENA